jgi:Flp pilus assembly protein TadD
MNVSVARGLVAASCLFLLVGCETTAPSSETASASPLSSMKFPDIFKSADSAAETTGSVATAVDGGPVVVSAPDPPSAVDDTYSPAANPDAKALLGGDRYDDLSMAKRFFRDGNYGLAERYYRRAAESHPRDAEAWLGLAAAYDRLKRFDLADRAYAQLLRLRGPTAEVLNNVGYSYMLRGDYTRANQKLREALAKDPDNPYVITNLTLLEESRTARKAIR